jgi:hypothetical protein
MLLNKTFVLEKGVIVQLPRRFLSFCGTQRGQSLSFSKELAFGIHTQANESIPCPNILLIQIHPNITFQSILKYSNKSVTFRFYDRIVPAFFICNVCSTFSVHLILVNLISSYVASHFAIKKEVGVLITEFLFFLHLF